ILGEARMAAAFNHPNVVSLFDFGEAEGTPYIVMELVEGVSLRAALSSPPASIAERLRWVTDIAGALAAAHRIGLVHRDVKPENVMVRNDGVVKVLDFGIARLATAGLPAADLEFGPTQIDATSAGETARGIVTGTPGYMAPELLA